MIFTRFLKDCLTGRKNNTARNIFGELRYFTRINIILKAVCRQSNGFFYSMARHNKIFH